MLLRRLPEYVGECLPGGSEYASFLAMSISVLEDSFGMMSARNGVSAVLPSASTVDDRFRLEVLLQVVPATAEMWQPRL